VSPPPTISPPPPPRKNVEPSLFFPFSPWLGKDKRLSASTFPPGRWTSFFFFYPKGRKFSFASPPLLEEESSLSFSSSFCQKKKRSISRRPRLYLFPSLLEGGFLSPFLPLRWGVMAFLQLSPPVEKIPSLFFPLCNRRNLPHIYPLGKGYMNLLPSFPF